MVNVGHFLVLSEEFGVDGFAVGGGQTKIKEHAGFLWLVEHSHVLRAEAHRSDGGPLGVVSTSAQHSEGVEFEELTFGQNGQRDLLVLIANVKDRVGDGGDITGVDGFELFISIGSRPPSGKGVENLAHGATLVLLNNIHAVLTGIREHQAFVEVGRNWNHGQSMCEYLVGQNVDRLHDLTPAQDEAEPGGREFAGRARTPEERGR